MKKRIIAFLMLVFLFQFISVSATTVGNLTIPSVLSDHMLLPRNRAINLWGRSASGTNVQVTMKLGATTIRSGSSVTAANGEWLVSLTSLPGSFTEYTVIISAGPDVITLEHVLVGEVWVAGGQSNMGLQVQYATDRVETMQTANHANLRIFTQDVPPSSTFNFSYTPLFDVLNGAWKPANSGSNIAECSSVAYSFGVKLFEILNTTGQEMPVGIINVATGGTSLHAWLSREKIEAADPLLKNKNYIAQADWNTGSVSGRFNQMTAQYNAKVAPLGKFGANGIIWYQGENNVGNGAGPYMRLGLKALAEDWSSTFGSPSGRLPFIFSQLTPKYYGKTSGYESTALPGILEGFVDAYLDLKAVQNNVAVIPVYDVELIWKDSSNSFQYQSPSHPTTKKPIGERMAIAARSVAFNQSGTFMPPSYSAISMNGNKAIVTFDNTDAGLKILRNEPKLRGFAICGTDLKYVEADAVIVNGNQVEVSSPLVTQPIAVTYAYTQMSNHSNLGNSADIPALLFRSNRTERKSAINANAGAIYHLVQPWMWCDSLRDWLFDDIQHAANNEVWISSPITQMGTSTFAADAVNKIEGKASLKVNYTTAAGQSGFGPKTDYLSLQIPNRDYEQYLPFALYGGLSLSIYNDDARAKQLRLLVTDESGQSCYLSNSEATSHNINISATAGWNVVNFRFDKVYDGSNGTTEVPNTLLLKAKKIQLIVVDGNGAVSGSIHIDRLQYSSSTTSVITSPVIKSTASGGLWNSPATWLGAIVPSPDDNVEIVAGATVSLNSPNLHTVNNLTVNGTLQYHNVVASYGSLQVNGDFTVNSSGVFKSFVLIGSAYTGKSLTLLGNLINDGMIDLSINDSATKGLTMAGNQPQNISGTGIFGVISYLNVNNAQGVTSVAPLDISRTLFLTNGILDNQGGITLDNKMTGSFTGTIASGQINRYGTSSINGDSVRLGTSSGATLILSYLGNVAMTESGEVPLTRTIHQLSINNSGGLTINDDLRLIGSNPLNLTNGIVTVLPGKTITCTNAGAATGNANSFIDGAVAMSFGATAVNRVFPIGSSGKNRKVSVNGLKAISGTANLKFSIVHDNTGTAGIGLASLARHRRWVGEITSGQVDNFTNINIDFGTDDGSDFDRVAVANVIDGSYNSLGAATAITAVSGNTNVGGIGTAPVMANALLGYFTLAKMEGVLSLITSNETMKSKKALKRNEIEVYPIPSYGNLKVVVAGGASTNIEFSLVDLSSKKLTYAISVTRTDKQTYDLQLSPSLPAGTYILSVQRNNVPNFIKVVKL